MQCFITFSRIQEWFWDTWWIRVMGSIWSLVKWNRIISKAVLSILYAGFSSHLTERPGWWKNKKSYKLIQSPYCPGWRGKSHSPFCRPLRQWWSPRHTWKHWGGRGHFFFSIFHAGKNWIELFLLWEPVLTRKWMFLEGYPAWPSLPSPSSVFWRAAAALWNKQQQGNYLIHQLTGTLRPKHYIDSIQENTV